MIDFICEHHDHQSVIRHLEDVRDIHAETGNTISQDELLTSLNRQFMELAENPQPDAEYGTTLRVYNPVSQAWDIAYCCISRAIWSWATGWRVSSFGKPVERVCFNISSQSNV